MILPTPQGYVYFGLNEDKSRLKIGFSRDPEGRMRAQKLIPLGCIPGVFADERAVHSLFAEHHQFGEWFAPVPEIIEFLSNDPKSIYPVPTTKFINYQSFAAHPDPQIAALGKQLLATHFPQEAA